MERGWLDCKKVWRGVRSCDQDHRDGMHQDPLWGGAQAGHPRGKTVWRGGLAQDTLARGLVGTLRGELDSSAPRVFGGFWSRVCLGRSLPRKSEKSVKTGENRPSKSAGSAATRPARSARSAARARRPARALGGLDVVPTAPPAPVLVSWPRRRPTNP